MHLQHLCTIPGCKMQRRKARNACGFVNQLFARQLSQKRGKVFPPICLRDLAPAFLSCALQSARSCSAHSLQHLPLSPIQNAFLRSPPTTVSAGFQQQQWTWQRHHRGQPRRHHVPTFHCAIQLGEDVQPCCSDIRLFSSSRSVMGGQLAMIEVQCGEASRSVLDGIMRTSYAQCSTA